MPQRNRMLFDFNGIYTDSLQLANVNGDWRIVNKFASDSERVRRGTRNFEPGDDQGQMRILSLEVGS